MVVGSPKTNVAMDSGIAPIINCQPHSANKSARQFAALKTMVAAPHVNAPPIINEAPRKDVPKVSSVG